MQVREVKCTDMYSKVCKTQSRLSVEKQKPLNACGPILNIQLSITAD